uniref:Uncharacterized protein n=1 Tax=Picea glauca TaxID=3330 RepID=A0A101M079_PICGL|nr:hypothetical protein ABT39_MTgene4463 [Picea glauca]
MLEQRAITELHIYRDKYRCRNVASINTHRCTNLNNS